MKASVAGKALKSQAVSPVQRGKMLDQGVLTLVSALKGLPEIGLGGKPAVTVALARCPHGPVSVRAYSPGGVWPRLINFVMLSGVVCSRTVSFNRKFLLNGTSLDLLTANTASTQINNEFVEALFGASTVLTINPTANIFLIYTTQNDSVGTVGTNKMATVQKMKL